jgi:hypothetical protein
MNYRQDLAAAHGRIHQLEQALLAKEAALRHRTDTSDDAPSTDGSAIDATSPDTTTPDATTPDATTPDEPTPLRWWHAWPPFALVALASTYLILFGLTMPRGQFFEEIAPLQRGFFLSGVIGSALMAVAYVLRARAEGRSTIGQRLLMALAAATAAPFVIVSGFFVFEAASILVSVVALGAMVLGGLYHGVTWVLGRQS